MEGNLKYKDRQKDKEILRKSGDRVVMQCFKVIAQHSTLRPFWQRSINN